MATLSSLEQETIINYNNAEKIANIYTCDPVLIRRLDRLVAKDKRITVEREDKYSKSYLVSKKSIRITLPRILTKEQREKQKTHLAKWAFPKKDA